MRDEERKENRVEASCERRFSLELFRALLRPPQTRKHCCGNTLWKHCFLGAQTGKHLFKKQNVSEKSQKHFLFLGSRNCFRNKCFLSAQTGKHLGKQQCFRINVSSFAGAFIKNASFMRIVYLSLISIFKANIFCPSVSSDRWYLAYPPPSPTQGGGGGGPRRAYLL